MVKKYTLNGGKKKKKPRPKKTQSKPKSNPKPKKKQTKKKCKPCEKKTSQIVDKVIDSIESIKRKNDDDEIEDLLLNSIDDLHKVYRLFKRIEDPSYKKEEEEEEEGEDLELELEEDVEEEPVEDLEEEPVEELKPEPVEELKEEPVEELKEEPVEELKPEPVEEEPVEELEQEDPVEEEEQAKQTVDPEEDDSSDLFPSIETVSSDPDPFGYIGRPHEDLSSEELRMTPGLRGGGKNKLKKILNELNKNN